MPGEHSTHDAARGGVGAGAGVTLPEQGGPPLTEFQLSVGERKILQFTKKPQITAVAELVWNALDANATEVDVELRRSSLTAITDVIVTDNGHGMTPKRARAAFQAFGIRPGRRRACPSAPRRPDAGLPTCSYGTEEGLHRKRAPQVAARLFPAGDRRHCRRYWPPKSDTPRFCRSPQLGKPVSYAGTSNSKRDCSGATSRPLDDGARAGAAGVRSAATSADSAPYGCGWAPSSLRCESGWEGRRCC
ncbi:ATP-binding protein [Streptomyces sp. NPDC016459]|uniref:ATP-binding protein n=1 Tax=Streptomyces sp. NPDC016459 TaxID=3157190 RepID=UPI0033E354ED